MKTPKMVAASIPPKTAVPSALRLPAPAPATLALLASAGAPHDALGRFPHRAEYLVVARVADENHPATPLDMTHDFLMNLGDERAGGVDHPRDTGEGPRDR